MHIQTTIAKGIVKDGKLEADVSSFSDSDVYIIGKEDFEIIAGSESARYQLEKALEALQEVSKADLPEEVKTKVEQVVKA
jgi:hypothetical protein